MRVVPERNQFWYHVTPQKKSGRGEHEGYASLFRMFLPGALLISVVLIPLNRVKTKTH